MSSCFTGIAIFALEAALLLGIWLPLRKLLRFPKKTTDLEMYIIIPFLGMTCFFIAVIILMLIFR